MKPQVKVTHSARVEAAGGDGGYTTITFTEGDSNNFVYMTIYKNGKLVTNTFKRDELLDALIGLWPDNVAYQFKDE